MSDDKRQPNEALETMDRRKFLQVSTALGTGMILTQEGSSQPSPGSDDVLEIALIGAGAQGQVLMFSCLKIPGIRFKAVCDIWTEYNLRRVSRILQKYRHEPATYVDYRKMLAKEKDLDAVIIATPDFCHADQTVDCLDGGIHVYCEKEMSNTREGASRMVEAARRSGKLLQIGHQRRSNPRYLHCYEKLIREAGILGRITTIFGQWNRSVQPDLGWPVKAVIDQQTLQKYGYESMHQFRNWRWYKGLGGGPIVDLGSHQIDIYNWFLDARPRAVMASGGTDYYDKKTHQWYDNVHAIYEYDGPQGVVRAAYQTITTNRNGGYFETFMGDQGTLYLSEAAGQGSLYREDTAPEWEPWVEKGFLGASSVRPTAPPGAALDVRETLAPPAYKLPVVFNDAYHKPHLENFFGAVKGQEKLNCPPDIGYETAVTVLRVNDAVEAERKVHFAPADFEVG